MVTLVVLVSVPILVAVVRASADDWIALGDQALIEIRARDVLTVHHPLLGTASSAALGADEKVLLNHPGSLMFVLVAAPVRLFGSAGLAFGVAAINVAAGVIGVVFAARRSGRAGAVAAALAFSGLGWAAGSESLYDPFNPTAAILTCLTCVIVAWSAIDGDRRALPWLLGTSAFVVQLHVSYLVYLVPLVVVTLFVVAVRTCRGEVPGARGIWLSAVVVFLAAWSQPLTEQLLHGGDGNMARMVDAVSAVGAHPGWRFGTQIAAATLSLPPWWARSGFGGISIFSPLPEVVLAALSIALTVIVCAAGSFWARRRLRADVATALLTSVVSTSVAWIGAIRSPMSSFFGANANYVRWLWPASVFNWLALGLGAWQVLLAYVPSWRDRRAVRFAAAGAVGIVGLANIPTHASREQNELARQRAPAHALIDQAASRIEGSAVLYRPPGGFDVYGPPLLARLQRDGVEFLVDDPVLVRQFGERRHYDGEHVAVLGLTTGMAALDAVTDPEVIAFTSELTPLQRHELRALIAQIVHLLRDGRIMPSALGRVNFELGIAEPWLSQLGQPNLNASSVARSLGLVKAFEEGLLDVDPVALAAVERLVTLRRAVEGTTAAVWYRPPGREGS